MTSTPSPAATWRTDVPVETSEPWSDDGEDPALPSGPYVRVSLGVGGGGYVYPAGTRNAAGFLIAIAGSIAARLGGGLVFGGTLMLDSLVAASGSGSGGSFSSPLAPFLAVGPMLGYEGEIVRFEAAVAIGIGGTLGTGPPAYGAGGFGLVILPLLAFRLADLGGASLDLVLRPLVGLLADNNTGAFAVWGAGSAGIGFVF